MGFFKETRRIPLNIQDPVGVMDYSPALILN